MKVIGLGDPDDEPMIDDLYGILCEARHDRNVMTLSLGELEEKKGKPNRPNQKLVPFMGITHVAGINMLWRASERTIRDSVRNALALAAQNGHRTITFPLISAGSGGFNQERAKTIMLDELRKLDSPPHATLRRS